MNGSSCSISRFSAGVSSESSSLSAVEVSAFVLLLAGTLTEMTRHGSDDIGLPPRNFANGGDQSFGGDGGNLAVDTCGLL